MNDVLELKGKRFVQASKAGSGGPSMNSKKTVTSEQLFQLREQINRIRKFWQQEKRTFDGILISVYS